MSWRSETLVGFDVETSGQYPLTAEICEIAAVKWRDGKIVDQFQSLVAVNKPMGEKVISIHHITNEMLIGAPSISEVIVKFHEFIKDSYLMAHHAPFDLGFIAPEFENLKLELPHRPVLCTSLLSRKAFPQSENHRLQTLIKFFNINQGIAHRALDDARACLEVGLKVFEKIGSKASMEDLARYQEANLVWTEYSIESLKNHKVYGALVKALKENSLIQIVYSGGSRPNQSRTVHPVGLVRNPLDDYFLAVEIEGEVPKRYFLKKITAARF